MKLADQIHEATFRAEYDSDGGPKNYPPAIYLSDLLTILADYTARPTEEIDEIIEAIEYELNQ